jgi:hypothetical protein
MLARSCCEWVGCVSDLEKAAAERVRVHREIAEREAQARAEREVREHPGEVPRHLSKEFFELARAHGAPIHPRYEEDARKPARMPRRTGDWCVIATGDFPQGQRLWAVAADGKVYVGKYLLRDRTYLFWLDSPRGFIATDEIEFWSDDIDWQGHFVAALAAVMEPVRVRDDYIVSGIAPTGWIIYER